MAVAVKIKIVLSGDDVEDSGTFIHFVCEDGCEDGYEDVHLMSGMSLDGHPICDGCARDMNFRSLVIPSAEVDLDGQGA